MGKKVALTGNEAAAHAMRQINPDVIAAFPITPSTPVPQAVAQFIADGEMDTELVTVESEHSAMSACIGAAAAGARVMTATSANGYALMWEMLYIASGMRLPIVMAVAARALSAPLNIHGDHSDIMGGRDTGWIQLISENSQEAYDNLIQAIKIAENEKVITPALAAFDGFNVSHAIEIWELEDDAAVKEFIGKYEAKFPLLNTDDPITHGAWAPPDWYFEHKMNQLKGLLNAKDVVTQVGKDFGKAFGREYGLYEAYKLDDADFVVVAAGSVCGTTKDVVDNLRENGVKAGLLKIRLFRPFPFKDIADALQSAKAIAVLDRVSPSGAQGGPLFNEIRSALYDTDTRAPVINYTYGLGGRDTQPRHINSVYETLKKIVDTGKVEKQFDCLNLRGAWG
ncbi:transketolase C-terminal domain-containing protein [Hippea maritima]|uniref:Pyruvate synthase n=1 Tax=Hippea maritima (strain ATCC 700847 / DSM 10411 / MH2) TaxID=760142 RepID=F2LUV4_HIPMA|nr:transketolase C-terminal domain-containing protein [Hippea maritima]AEA33559.1 Pyruvate synthase [Hippea maritima DSM 10411]